MCVCVCVCLAQIEKSLPSPQVNEEEIVRCESIDALQELTEMLGGAAAKEENKRIRSAGNARATSAAQQTMQAEQEMDEDAWAVEEADMIKRSLAAQREAVFSPSPRARAHTHTLTHYAGPHIHPASLLHVLGECRRRILVHLTPWDFVIELNTLQERVIAKYKMKGATLSSPASSSFGSAAAAHRPHSAPHSGPPSRDPKIVDAVQDSGRAPTESGGVYAAKGQSTVRPAARSGSEDQGMPAPPVRETSPPARQKMINAMTASTAGAFCLEMTCAFCVRACLLFERCPLMDAHLMAHRTPFISGQRGQQRRQR